MNSQSSLRLFHWLCVVAVGALCMGQTCTEDPAPDGNDPTGTLGQVAEFSNPGTPAAQQDEILTCDAGGPYAVECAGATTTAVLDGSASSTTGNLPLTYLWTSDCPGASFDDATSATPTLSVDTSAGCSAQCKVTLTISDGVNVPASCDADVTIAEPKVLSCNAGGPYAVQCAGATTTVALDGSASSTTGNLPLTYLWTSDCPGASFDDATSATPTLSVDTSVGCSVQCKVTLTISDGVNDPESCDADLTVSEPVVLTCNAGGPYAVQCAGATTTVALDGSASSTTGNLPLTYLWTSDCPGASFDDATSATPTLSVDTSVGCSVQCKVTLTISDGVDEPASCDADVTISDSTPPVIQLTGDSVVTVECHTGIYDELGATVTDACDIALTAATVGGDVVDVNTVGTYVVTYDATDACGNPAPQVTRTVNVVDTTPPEFTTAPQDMTVECDGSGNAAELQAWLAGAVATDGCGSVTVTNDFTALSDDCGATGSAMVTWTATDDAGLTATTSAAFTIVDTTLPAVQLTGDSVVTVECHIGIYDELGATVTDACDTALTAATVGGDVVDVNTVGTYVVTYDATDACGNPAPQVTRTVNVVDTTPPDVTVQDLVEIWPPNHKYETFRLSDLATAVDACEGALDIDALGTIVSIYSDEPEDAAGMGDGNTSDDIVILSSSSFQVRAERQGGGNGRVYGVAFEIADAAGNMVVKTALLGVPHDQSGDPPIDDGPDAGYTVP